MCTKKLLLWLCSAGMLFNCGCVSNKITMNPPVTAVVIPDSNPASYKIEKVKITATPYVSPAKWYETFSDRFTRMAYERYPGLFNDSPSSIPIAVRIDINQEIHSTESFVVYLCTLCIVGGILPSVPWSTEWQVNIGAEDIHAPLLASSMKVEHRGWWSVLTPLGWIEVPGKTDAPVVSSTMFTSGPGIIPDAYRTYAIQCMIDLLAKELLSGKPPTRPGQPVLPGSEQPSSSLQLPMETVAPF